MSKRPRKSILLMLVQSAPEMLGCVIVLLAALTIESKVFGVIYTQVEIVCMVGIACAGMLGWILVYKRHKEDGDD